MHFLTAGYEHHLPPITTTHVNQQPQMSSRHSCSSDVMHFCCLATSSYRLQRHKRQQEYVLVSTAIQESLVGLGPRQIASRHRDRAIVHDFSCRCRSGRQSIARNEHAPGMGGSDCEQRKSGGRGRLRRRERRPPQHRLRIRRRQWGILGEDNGQGGVQSPKKRG